MEMVIVRESTLSVISSVLRRYFIVLRCVAVCGYLLLLQRVARCYLQVLQVAVCYLNDVAHFAPRADALLRLSVASGESCCRSLHVAACCCLKRYSGRRCFKLMQAATRFYLNALHGTTRCCRLVLQLGV